ncbi:MAG: VOC family protein [Proteobacteria bacterium]|nr:VOC family protein [Pseudomonadota bacterium]MBU0990553.1 VOC family protein [Pseudomonadota bacterium]
MDNTNIVFDHVHIISKDPESAATWYVEKLGGKIINSQEVRGAPQVVVAFGDITIIVRGQRPGEEVVTGQGMKWGTDHFGFRVEGDFDGFCDDLKEKGVTFSLDPVDFTPNIRIAFIDAPDEVSIELLQRKG